VPAADNQTSAREAINGFVRHLASRQFAASTQRVRRHFLEEYLDHAQQANGAGPLTVAGLLDPARTDAWLADAAAGKTRSRMTLRGREASANPNSMRVRIDTFNAFAEYLGAPGRQDTQRPADGYRLTAEENDQLLHDLAVRRPLNANATTSLRTAALAALVADTDRSVPELAGLRVSALHLTGAAHIDLADGPCPIRSETVQILSRWLSARSAIIAELEGSDPGHLWIPTKPGRPRGGREPVKPGLEAAAVRTLHHAHRTLVSQVLGGATVRPGAIQAAGPARAARAQEPGQPEAGPAT